MRGDLAAPRVSIVLATNRGGPYLGDTLGSVQDQTFEDWELVVVDDGGADGAAIDEAVRGVAGARVLHQKPGGLAMARNAGASHTRGEFLVFLDDDDVWHPDRLRRQVESLDAGPDAVASYSAGWHIDATGAEVSAGWPPVGHAREQLLSGAVDIPRIVTLMVRRDPFFALGGFNTAFRYAEDDEFILRMLRFGEFVGIADRLVGYRRHPNNMSGAPLRQRQQWSNRAIAVQRWAAEGRGDRIQAELIKLNQGAFRRRNASAWLDVAVTQARQGRVVAALRAGGRALTWAPGAASADVSRRLLGRRGDDDAKRDQPVIGSRGAGAATRISLPTGDSGGGFVSISESGLRAPSVDVPSVSVVVVTYNRPEHVRVCLRHISEQTVAPAQTIVVDSSPDEATETIVREQFPAVHYLRNPRGAGTTATARALGLRAVDAEIVAFLDDDAYGHPGWLAEMLAPFIDPTVGGVGGRVRNGQPNEENDGDGQIGMLLPNGTLTGYFAADPGRMIEVDHLLGASMAYRVGALRQIGGIHDFYPGTCLREETDIALRVKAAGWKLVFNPAAVVDHVAGPYAKGRRFDLRYVYFSQRNHVVLLGRVYGTGAPVVRRYFAHAGRSAVSELAAGFRSLRSARDRGARATTRSVFGGIARASVIGAGLGSGLAVTPSVVRRSAPRAGGPAS